MKIILVIITLAYLVKKKELRDIDELFESLEIEDKCGQMTQISLDVIKKDIVFDCNRDEIVAVDYDKLVKYLKDFRIGSIMNTFGATAISSWTNISAYSQPKAVWQKIIRLIHQVSLNSTKLKIPIIYGIDSIHGSTYIDEATLFPHQINQAATFNLEIPKKIGRITATETRAVGIHWNFSPILDVARQLLWTRVYETYGEDPFLASKMGESYIKGHLGDNDLKKSENAATCLKHFIGYSFPFNGRDKTPSYIPENLLREVFLPSFEAGIKAGSPTVMLNTAEINGIPGHANSYYINDILKGELKFDGFVVSDWEDVIKLHTRNKIAETHEEAVRIAVMAGLDMSMVPNDSSFFEHCVNLTKKDDKFLERVNDATKRILRIKKRLGLLEDNFDDLLPAESDLDKIGTEESERFNLEAARESIILAKNERNILPLKKNSDKKILVTGPTANLRKTMNGGWSYTWQGNTEEAFYHGRNILTFYQAVSTKANNVVYKEGANLTSISNLEETLNEARTSDYIILCLGEEPYTETIGNINSIMLHDAQLELSRQILNLNKPTIVVYYAGRPRVMTEIVNQVDGVLLCFLPGNKGGEAAADILFGNYNPSARLPITYPKQPNAFITYDYKPSERFEGDVNEQILFPFGHGLSYTHFTYSNLKLDQCTLDLSENQTDITVTVDISNTGTFDGKHTVILYVNDEYASIARPVKQVKGFIKVFLEVNKTKRVGFVMNAYDDLSFIDATHKRKLEPGYFNVYVGDLEARFLVKN